MTDIAAKDNAVAFTDSLQRSADKRASKYRQAEEQGFLPELERQQANADTLADQMKGNPDFVEVPEPFVKSESQKAAKDNALAFRASLQRSAASRAAKFRIAEEQGFLQELERQQANADKLADQLKTSPSLIKAPEPFVKEDTPKGSKANAVAFKASLQSSADSRASKFRVAEEQGLLQELERQQAYADQLASQLKLDSNVNSDPVDKDTSFSSSLRKFFSTFGMTGESERQK